ncbi:MAG TPA: hypoxanthine phosphoribosyltransferase [Bacteroidetes bacterium]|nr:hypoxanthine phosphoribosyltransferase [Bacteroidota bacterium]
MKTDTIQIHDKKFEPYLTFEEIDRAIQQIADRLNKELKDKNPLFIPILNGAFMFAADLFKKLNFPCEVSFVKFASYVGTSSSENVKQLIGLNHDIKGRSVVIVEDIIDSGLTIHKILDLLEQNQVKDVKIATLLLKPDAFKGTYKVDYVGLNIPNDFIVGYGLDYNQQGRNYKDIYKIIE